MSLEELYTKVTNEHLPPSVRKLAQDPMAGGLSSVPVTSEWKQFGKVGEDQAETVKVDSLTLFFASWQSELRSLWFFRIPYI